MTKSKQSLEKAILISMLFFTSCASDNYDDYYGGTCDVDNVLYSSTITPIIKNQCLGCHNSDLANGGVLLETYEQVKKQVDNGKLLGTIKHLPGFSPMPEGGKLDECTILKIETWINNGALNN